MLPQTWSTRQNARRRSDSVYWVVIVTLSVIAGGSLYVMQNTFKEVASLKLTLDTAESQRRGLSEQIGLHKQRLEQAEIKAKSARSELLASQKDTSVRWSEAMTGVHNTTAIIAQLKAKLAAAESKLLASEKEVKEITVKAGTCQQQFASLNADCATLKQGLANPGQNSKAVDPVTTSSTANAAGLDFRGGVGAAEILKEQQPWKKPDIKVASSRVQVRQPSLLHDGEGTLLDETGPGLEKALVQGAYVVGMLDVQ